MIYSGSLISSGGGPDTGTVLALNISTNSLVGQSEADPATGEFSIDTGAVECYLICLSSSQGSNAKAVMQGEVI